ncbi:MAG: TylF/MycF/NovP-related O-methyltransferase [Bacteroidota bacterium]
MKKLFSPFLEFLRKKNIYIVRSLLYDKESSVLPLKADYIRTSTLELFAREANTRNIHGSVAELGVYQGSFASAINQVFPDRKLYLFDTFEGFDKRDIQTEIANNFSEGNQDFSATSVESVLGRMKYPQNCVVKKGYFPESARGMDNEEFVFVSIDTDLYEPILKGLEFFYPKLVKGGCIFIHDFNNHEYTGARKAVYDYCTNNRVSYLPLADIGGSVVIIK